MKKWLLISIAVFIVLGGGFVWFWSLSSVPTEGPSNVTLRVERSPVTVRAPGGTAFEEAMSGTVLAPGTTVKTGEGGEAVIVFFDQAETRLDANSEVTISIAERDPNDSTKSTISLDLGLGRIWSRVLRLFDLDSTFSVKTSSVVATVRGTAFDIRANADETTEVWVSDSAVTVTPTGETDAANGLSFEKARMRSGVEIQAVTCTPAHAACESAR
jgi:hypothetical protein